MESGREHHPFTVGAHVLGDSGSALPSFEMELFDVAFRGFEGAPEEFLVALLRFLLNPTQVGLLLALFAHPVLVADADVLLENEAQRETFLEGLLEQGRVDSTGAVV